MGPIDVDARRLRQRTGVKWSRYRGDAEVLPAWVADMDLPVPDCVTEALTDYVARGDLGYPDEQLPDAVREAFSRHFSAAYGWQVAPDTIDFVHDAVQAIHFLTHHVGQPGDGVVLTTPLYPPFHAAVAEYERRALHVPFTASADGWRLELDALGALDDPPAPGRLLHVCNPHNPTGRVLTRTELESLAASAIEHDLVVVSDEIHADLILDDVAHVPFASLGPEVAARTVTITSATKTFNMAAANVAVVVFGSERLRAGFPSLRSRFFGKPNVFGLLASQAALQHGRPWHAQTLARLRDNRDHLAARLRTEAPSIGFHPPEATYLAWLDLRRTPLVPDPAAALYDRVRLVVSDGAEFGTEGEGFVRLNYATPRGVLDEMIDRLVAAVSGARHPHETTLQGTRRAGER